MRGYTLLILISLILFSSCMDNGRKGLKRITAYTKDQFTGNTANYCEELTILEKESCYDSCPDNYKEATDNEVISLINELSKSYPNEQNARDDFFKIYNNAKGVCIPDIKRPSLAININNNYCACDLNKPFIENNCDNFCSSKYDSPPTLYANVTLSHEVKDNPKLGSLYNWCNQEIDDGNYSPSCIIEVSDGNTIINLEADITNNSNSFQADLSFMEENKTYILKLKEITSGAITSSIQLVRKNSNSTYTPLLKTTVNQYTCITSSGYISGNNNFYEHSARLHYYYQSGHTPDPLPPGNDFLYCHDKTYGNLDSYLYPRLELINGAFMLFNDKDTRFYDTNNDSYLDINKEIADRMADGSIINLFNPFSYSREPNKDSALIGFYLQPFIDANSQIPFCPNSSHFNSGQKIFSILKDYLGGDTEAIYIAKREPKLLKNAEGNNIQAPDDYIFIRESDLQKIWFYTLGETRLKHTQSTSRSLPIMFFYPADINYPLIKKAHQSTYTIISPNESDPYQIRTGIIPSDKRIGCIPK